MCECLLVKPNKTVTTGPLIAPIVTDCNQGDSITLAAAVMCQIWSQLTYKWTSRLSPAFLNNMVYRRNDSLKALLNYIPL